MCFLALHFVPLHYSTYCSTTIFFYNYKYSEAGVMKALSLVFIFRKGQGQMTTMMMMTRIIINNPSTLYNTCVTRR